MLLDNLVMDIDKKPEWEVSFLESLHQRKKINQAFRSTYFSSTVASRKATLGTVEADSSGDFGRWAKEPFRAAKFAEYLCNFHDFSTVLDVGAGDRVASGFFQGKGKSVTAVDYESSPYIEGKAPPPREIDTLWGDFLEMKLERQFDLVWVSHVLEHQENIGLFLRKVVEATKPEGLIAITVPPRKPYIVSGHVNLFNPGLLVYRLVLAGIDCSLAKVFQQDGNISIIVPRSKRNLPQLNYDVGDLELLSEFFPFPTDEAFNGDFMQVGLSLTEFKFIFPDANFDEFGKR